MNLFKEKLHSDVRIKLFEIMGATLEQFLEGTRRTFEEYDVMVETYIRNEGIEYARKKIYWEINSISCIIQERELGRHMSTEEIQQNAQRYGLD